MGFEISGREVVAAAAVVIADRPTASVLLIERGIRETDPWSGHVAFPGGRRESSDPDPVATAIRECREEVGIELSRESCCGALTVWSPMSRPEVLVAPIVFLLPNTIATGTSAEATESFWVDLQTMASSKSRAARATSRGEFEVDCFRVGRLIVWGFTYKVLKELMEIAGYIRA